MATYKVQDNGKAQSGLKTGDKVVTGGGTYKITGVNADGSYKTTKINDTTTSTYTGSYANSSGGSYLSGGTIKNTVGNSGGNSSSDNSGGGSSSSSTKNSQYTAPTLGDTWNADTDYQAIINSAVANGDYVTAAKAEQLRNQKITSTGSNYNTTNLYTKYLDKDYGTIGQQLMANGASAQDVLDIWNARREKALTTEGLEKYANDEIQQMMWNYIEDKMKSENEQEAQDMYNQWVEEYEQEHPKEEFESKYDTQIDALLNEILNRDDFSYDAMNDPLYQQYAAMYQREGDRAMKETLAEAAAGAGGMNTYAITAAQQANSYYNSQLNDKIPELYQLAYNMYLNDKESKVQDWGILQSMDATQYNRYRDTINDYYADKNFAYGVYNDAVQQGNWQQTYDYNSLWDERNFNYNDYWTNKEFDNTNYWNEKNFDNNNYWNEKNYGLSEKELGIQQAQINAENSRYDQAAASDEVWAYIKLGVVPSADLIARAGMSQTDVALAVAAVTGVPVGGSSSGGGSGGGSSTKKTGGNGNGYTGGGTDTKTSPYKNENYSKVANACEELASSGDKWGAAALAKESVDKGYISQSEYNELLRKYNPALDSMLSISPENMF